MLPHGSLGSLGRAGELDPKKWAGSRVQPQFPTAYGASGVRHATIPHCRDGVGTEVFPDSDALICDPNDTIASNHLLVAVGAQNYGQNSYRIRQPFDFAQRTGSWCSMRMARTCRSMAGCRWRSPKIRSLPRGSTRELGMTKAIRYPRMPSRFSFNSKCDGTAVVPSVGLRFNAVYKDYQATLLQPKSLICMTTSPGHLNHFEVTLSQNKIEVFGTDYSDDGKAFGEPRLMYSSDIDLPFTRGNVNITTHNHATMKYSNETLDAWVVPGTTSVSTAQ